MSPWHVDKDGPVALTIRDGDACTIAYVESRAIGASPSQKQSANLIAAAPDMHAVLGDLEESFDKQTYDERIRGALGDLPAIPDDHEYTVNITHKQWRALVAALNKAGAGS